MDNVTRSALTVVGLVALVAVATGSRRHSSYSWDSGSYTSTLGTTTTVDAGPSAPDPSTVPDPTTDYKTIDDAKLDGAKAIGKTLLLHVWRGSTDATTVTLFACGKIGTGGYLNANYSAEKRDLVKAIPSTLSMHDDCPRIVVKITGKQEYTNDLKGELQTIMDVTPKPPPVLPAGVDYVTMDDVSMDGKKATGKIALLKAYRGNTEEKKFTAYPCALSGGLNFVYVNFTSDQKDMVKDLSTSSLDCKTTIKVKLTSQQPYTSTWNASLIEVTKGE